MKKENIVLIYSMINNGIIAILKIGGGLFFKLESLFADGLHTISDLVTDIFCMIGLKLSKKRPTKYHPFGFGRLEYLTNLFIGIVLFLLGIFICLNSFKVKKVIPPISLVWLILVTIVLKYIAIKIMSKVGRTSNSEALITSAKESKMDLYSSIGVLIITLLLQLEKEIPIFKYADMVGTIIIGLMVLKLSIKIIVSNSLSLMGEVEKDREVIKHIEDYIMDISQARKCYLKLIKYGAYYALDLTLVVDGNMSFKNVVKLEQDVKKKILKKRSLKIKSVMIYATLEDKKDGE